VALKDGVPAGTWKQVLALGAMEPGGLTVDGAGRIYVSEPNANKVHQYAADGKALRSYGRLDMQKPGTYDR
jgi:sugar lactone lactonase YvrE